MADKTAIQFEGFFEFQQLLEQMEKDFGPKDSKAILRKTMRKAMQPVLQTAKILAPVDSGALVASLQIEARKPTRKDRRSKYVSASDVAIAQVTTAPGRKLSKKGIPSDARAVANEFGTAKMPGKPFMRPALESQSAGVISLLGDNLKQELERYKARQARRAAKLKG